MVELSRSELKKEVKAILRTGDLRSLTSRVVRETLQSKLGLDLSHRKKDIDAVIMAEVEDKNNSHSEEEEEEEEEVSEEEAPAPKPRKKKAESDSDAEVDDDEADGDDDYKPVKAVRKPKPSKKRRNEDDSDEDWGKRKKKKGGAKGPRKASAFTKSFKLSAELADVVGSDTMPRHEVVKKLWAVIKERELQDPKNKQYAICDDQLMKVIGVRRFRTFGMMKHLKDHFLEAVN